jgi:hypothetical protein
MYRLPFTDSRHRYPFSNWNRDIYTVREDGMKRILIISILALMVICGYVSADEKVTRDANESIPEKTHVSFFGGYYFADIDGSRRAAEFEYLHDSISFGGELRALILPHRIHFDLNVKNKKDFFGDGAYAYRDIVLLRARSRSLFHNLSDIELIDLDPSTSSPGVDIRGVSDKTFGREFRLSEAAVRMKTPDFPMHVYVTGSLLEKDGFQQQRSLLGGGWFNNIVRSLQDRDVDLETTSVTVGTNSHLGPVEVDISHSEKKLDVNGDRVLYDSYTQTGFGPPPGTRAEGVYPHNLIPEFKSSSNTVKLHTSYTGSLVASATFTKTDKENRDSDTQADYFVGSGQVTWVASPRLVFFTRYRYKEYDVDNPDSVTITDMLDPSNTYTYDVRQSVSSITNIVSQAVRFKPLTWLTLKGKYSYEDIHRKDAGEWHLPDSTQRNNVSVSSDIKIVKGLKLKTKYFLKDVKSPAYNTDPDLSHKGAISVSWVPSSLPKFSTFLSYSLTREKRNDLHFVDTDEPDERDVAIDNFFGSITFLIMKNLSATASYAYMSHKTEQDIEYHDDVGDPFVDTSVPYKDKTNCYSFNISYMPKNRVNLSAGVLHRTSKGQFIPGEQDLLEPVSIASFSRLKIKETEYSISGEYSFRGGISSGIRYRFSDFDDVLDNPHDDIEDGEVHVVLLTLAKKI